MFGAKDATYGRWSYSNNKNIISEVQGYTDPNF